VVAYRQSAPFTEREKLVQDYAVSRNPVEVSNALVIALRRHLDDAQPVELTHVIALGNLRGRFNPARSMGAAGFREGVMRTAPASAPPAPNRLSWETPSAAMGSLCAGLAQTKKGDPRKGPPHGSDRQWMGSQTAPPSVVA